MRLPCTDWVRKLSARHQDDLPPSDRRALHEHLASCGACNQVYSTYKTLEVGLRCLTTTIQPIPEFSFELVQPAGKPPAATSLFSFSSLLSLLLTTFSAMYVKIIWSPLFQALHTWTLVILSKFPRRIAIGSSGNRFLYVMRSDSGYFLWRHKRYRRSELVSSMPIRGSGMLFTGSGTALAAALDFCKYAVQA